MANCDVKRKCILHAASTTNVPRNEIYASSFWFRQQLRQRYVDREQFPNQLMIIMLMPKIKLIKTCSFMQFLKYKISEAAFSHYTFLLIRNIQLLMLG